MTQSNLWEDFDSQLAPDIEWIDPPMPKGPEGPNGPLEDSSAEKILADIEAESGAKFSAARRATILSQIRKGDFTFAAPEADAANMWSDFDSNLLADGEEPHITPKATIEEPSISGFLQDMAGRILTRYGGAAVDAAQGTVQEAGGQGLRYANEEGGLAGRFAAQEVQALKNPMQYLVDIGKNTTDEAVRGTAADLLAASAANKQAVQKYKDEEGILPGFGSGLSMNTAKGIGLDVAANPDMALTQLTAFLGPEVSGVVATLPAGRVYLNDYYDQISKGVPKEEAKRHAYTVAGIEQVMETVPGLKWGKPAKAALAAPVRGLAERVARKVGEEFGTEAVTELAQRGLDNVISAFDIGSEASQRVAEEQGFKSVTEAASAATYAGVVGSVAAGGPATVSSVIEKRADTKAEQAKVAPVLENALAERMAADKKRQNESKADDLLTLDLKREQEKIAQEKAKQDAFDQADKERAAREAAQTQEQNDQQEADYRNQEIERQYQGQTRLDKYPDGSMERVPVNPPEGWTAEKVREEREQAEKAEAERKTRVELGKRVEFLRKRQTVATEKATKDKVKEEKKARTAELQLRRDVADKLVAENPGKDPATLEPLFNERLAAAKAEAAAQAAKAAGKPKKGQKAAQKAKPKGVVGSMLAEMGLDEESLDMASDEPPIPGSRRTPPKNDVPALLEKATTLFNTLIEKRGQQAADVRSIMMQGKLVVATTADSIGRKDLGAASYDPKTGKTYLYLDKVDPKNPVESIVRAIHEATHVGQDNKRADRATVMEMVMGKGHNDAKKKVIAAARNGNAIAKEALRRAEEAAGKAKEQGKAYTEEEIRDLELMPYFAGEVARARGSMLGQAGGAARDMKAAFEGFLRSKLGVKLDVSFDEIAKASQETAGEIVKTDVKPRRKGGTLDMIGGEQGKKFADADFIYRGVVDGKLRYEFSDEDASMDINSKAFEDFAEGKRVTLDSILKHPELYENYPQLATLPIFTDPKLAGTNTKGVFHGLGKGIAINPDIVYFGSDLLDTTLHEVQHAVQRVEGFVPGANSKYLIDPRLKPAAEEAQRTYDSTLKSFDYEGAVESLPTHIKNKWLMFINRPKPEGWNTEANEVAFLRGPFANEVTDRDIKEQIKNYKWADKQRKDTKFAVIDAESAAFKLYVRDYGETEARNTEYRRRMTKEQRAAERPESTMVKAREKVAVEDTLNARTVTKAGAENFGSASEEAPTHDIVNVATGKVVDKAASLTEAIAKVKELGGGSKYWARKIKTPEPASDETLDMADEKESPKDQLLREGLANSDIRSVTVTSKQKGKVKMDDGTVVPAVATLYYNTAKWTSEVLAVLRDMDGKVLATATDISMSGTRPDWVMHRQEKGLDERTVKSLFSKTNRIDEVDTTLDMAEEAVTPKLPFTRKIPAWVSGILSSSGGVGRKARAILENALSSPSGQRMIAEGIAGKYRRAVAKEAALRGIPAAELNAQIIAAIDAVDKKSDSYEENLAAYEKAIEPFGEAGRALFEFRLQVDQLSIAMLKERHAQAVAGNPLSDDEKATYKTIAANLGRYAHRQYAVNMAGAGKAYADDVWKAYEKFVKGKKSDPATKKKYDTVARAVKRLVDDELYIPDDEGISEMSTERLKRMFSTWGGVTNITPYSLDQMREKLAEIRDEINGDKDRLRNEAEAIVKQILGLATPTSTVSKYYRGGKLDKGILKERGDIAPEIRALMGEIKDPAAQLLSTVAKQAEFVARSKMLLELKNLNDPAHVQPPSATGTNAVKDMVLLEGDKYGPLENHYVSKNLYNMLSDHIQQLATFEQAVAMAAARPDALRDLAMSKGMRAWARIASTTKMMQIIYNPANFAYNFFGGWSTMFTNGNIGFTNGTFKEAFGTAADIIGYAIDPSRNTERARRVTSAGVTDSAFVGEITAGLHKDILKAVNEMKGVEPSALKEWAGKKFTQTKETYAMMDVVYKIADFYHQADVVLPAYYKAAGISKTQEEIDREAADIVNDTHVTYKRAMPAIRAIEKYGISNFGVFFYEVFRSQINNVRQGFKELDRANHTTNPEAATIMRMQGAKRLIGQATVWSMMAALSKMMAASIFGDDDEEERKKRALLPDYMQNQDFVSIGKTEDGKDVLLQASRFDPAGPMTDLMRTAITPGGDLEALKANFLQLYVAPRIGAKLYEAAVQLAGKNDKKVPKPLVQEIFPESFGEMLGVANKLSVEDRTVQALANVSETFAPGIAGSWRESNARPIVENPVDAAFLAMTYMGGRMYKIDGQAMMTTAAFEYKDTLARNRKLLVEKFNNQPNMSEAEVMDHVLELREMEKETFDDAHLIYQGLVANGTPQRDINAKLKGLGLSGANINALRTGKFKSSTISAASLKEFERRELSTASREDKAEIKKKWNSIRDMLEAVHDRVEEE